MENEDSGMKHNGPLFGGDNPNSVNTRPSDFPEDDKSHPLTGDGASPGKIFIGGLARETTAAEFVRHFGKYGDITDSVIMRDRKTGQPRGFGFVTYADASVVDQVIQDTHIINGKQVEIKRTIPKGAGGSKDFRTRKIFVGGIPTTMTDDEFKDFFTRFGEVTDHQIMRDHATGRSRGFGFITFDSEQSVDDILSNGNKIEMAGSQVEVKKAEPKKPNPPSYGPSKRQSNPRSAYGGGFGDSYSGYEGGGYSAGSFRSGATYAGRTGGYGGGGAGAYDVNDFGGYGGYDAGGIGAYRVDPSLGYAGRYGAGFNRGYNMGVGYGAPADSYQGFGGAAGAVRGGYGASYDSSLGGGYAGSTGGSFYGGRGGYGGMGSGRYHPYGR